MTLTAHADEIVGLVRAWTAAQKAEHPRWPAHTPGGLGGQFMETGEGLVKQIAGAFERVQTPQGRAQILSELNPEQLAGVAKAATAVQIPRGASRDEIIRTLSSPVRGGRPAAPGAPTAQQGGSAAKVSAPDGWSEVDVAEQRKQSEAKLKAALDRSDAPDKEKLQRLGMRLIDDMYGSHAGRTFQRGNVTVTVAGGVQDIDQADLDLVTRRMEALQAAFPQAGPVSVTVMPRATMERLGGDRRAGIALPSSATGGQSVFMLHEGGFKHIPESGEMPAHADEKLTEAEWTMVHEFGHLLERRSGESGDLHETHSHGGHDHGLSDYGRTNPQEGYAEAFAEWWVSDGKTDNAAAKAYAERFGWPRPGEVSRAQLGEAARRDEPEAREAGASLSHSTEPSIVDALAAVEDDPADPRAAPRQRWELLRHMSTAELRDTADRIGVRVPPEPEEGEFDQNALATFVAHSYQKPKKPRAPRQQQTPEARAAAVDALREKYGDWRDNPDVLGRMNRDELRVAAADLGVPPGSAGSKVDALRAMLVKAAHHQKATGFRPGRWEPIEPSAIREEALRQARAALERAGRQVDEAQLQQLADEIVADGDQTFRNGHYTVSIHPNVYHAFVDPQQVQDTLERLVSQHPDAGPVSVRIVPESMMPPEHTHLGLRYTYGEVTPEVKKQVGTSAIVLSDRLFSHADEKSPHGHFMPASRRASRVEYVLAHEFGHVLEPPIMDNPRDVPGMSRYGREDMHEEFAEAFAEWFLSGGGGKRGGNGAARAFAEHYGWPGAESEHAQTPDASGGPVPAPKPATTNTRRTSPRKAAKAAKGTPAKAAAKKAAPAEKSTAPAPPAATPQPAKKATGRPAKRPGTAPRHNAAPDITRDAPLARELAALDPEGRSYTSRAEGQDRAAVLLAERLGFDHKPRVVDPDDFDRMLADGQIDHEMYRGTHTSGDLSGAEIHRRLREGDLYMSYGREGSGTYMSLDADAAAQYAQGRGGSLARYAMRSDARVIDADELMRQHAKWMKDTFGSENPDPLPVDNPEFVAFGDQGRWAMAHGYDAIVVPAGHGRWKRRYGQLVVLNRGALVAERPSPTSDAELRLVLLRHDLPTSGGRAAMLARLRRAGIQVPKDGEHGEED